jgi:uncharacterized protein YehS (DUF1456 family)
MEDNRLIQLLRQALMLTEDDLITMDKLLGRERLAGEITLSYFLEGLILSERGPRADGAVPMLNDTPLSNNQVLKKLRIALNLQEHDMQLIFEEGGVTLSGSEFGALFRKTGNKHFRPCSDELLQHFIAGLTPSLDN